MFTLETLNCCMASAWLLCTSPNSRLLLRRLTASAANRAGVSALSVNSKILGTCQKQLHAESASATQCQSNDVLANLL